MIRWCSRVRFAVVHKQIRVRDLQQSSILFFYDTSQFDIVLF